MNIPIKKNAPAVAAKTIKIEAPVSVVWNVLTDINNWPAWQKSVTESKLSGELNEGAVFKWKAGGMPFNSRIHTKKNHTQFGWTGTTFGASAVHNWHFEQKGNKTLVKVEESLQGALPGLLKRWFQKKLDEGMQTNLEELKEAAENRFSKTKSPLSHEKR
jgi:uncharacterized membrane protein